MWTQSRPLLFSYVPQLNFLPLRFSSAFSLFILSKASKGRTALLVGAPELVRARGLNRPVKAMFDSSQPLLLRSPTSDIQDEDNAHIHDFNDTEAGKMRITFQEKNRSNQTIRLRSHKRLIATGCFFQIGRAHV